MESEKNEMYMSANWLSEVVSSMEGDSASGGSSLRIWAIFACTWVSAALVSKFSLR